MVKLLLDYGANINARVNMNKWRSLFIRRGEDFLVEKMEVMFQEHLEENFLRINRGATALHIAAQEGYGEIVKLLCEREAKVNILSRFENPGGEWEGAKETALHKAVRNGHSDCVATLLFHQADPEIKGTLKTSYRYDDKSYKAKDLIDRKDKATKKVFKSYYDNKRKIAKLAREKKIKEQLGKILNKIRNIFR